MEAEAILYACVDIEASGPVPGLYSMLSLAAVEVKGTPGAHAPGEGIYLEMKPLPGAMEDPAAMAVHGLDADRLAQEGLDPAEALVRLSRWVEEKAAGARPVFVGHNAPFDWSFVNWYHARFGVANPFGYKALDTKALAMGALRLPWFETHKGRLAEELEGVPAEDLSAKHRADYDAHLQARILCALLDRLEL